MQFSETLQENLIYSLCISYVHFCSIVVEPDKRQIWTFLQSFQNHIIQNWNSIKN